MMDIFVVSLFVIMMVFGIIIESIMRPRGISRWIAYGAVLFPFVFLMAGGHFMGLETSFERLLGGNSTNTSILDKSVDANQDGSVDVVFPPSPAVVATYVPPVKSVQEVINQRVAYYYDNTTAVKP